MQHSRHRKLSNRFKALKGIARRRGFTYRLTMEQYIEIMGEQRCHYCQEDLSYSTGPSVDRCDSSRGYVYGNLVACCSKCNLVKSNLLTKEEMCYIVKILRRKRKKLTGPLWPRRKKNGIQKCKRKRSV